MPTSFGCSCWMFAGDDRFSRRFNILQTEQCPEPLPCAFCLGQRRFAFQNLRGDLLTIRDRKRLLLQMFDRYLRSLFRQAHSQDSGQPVFEQTDATQTTLIAELPMAHQVGLGFEWHSDLEIPENVLEIAQVFSGFSMVTCKMDLASAAAQLATELAQNQQFISAGQNMHGI